MKIVCFKGSRIKFVSPRDVKIVLCMDRNVDWNELLSMNDREVWGKQPITVKFPEECLKKVDVLAKQFNIKRGRLIRKAYVYGRKKGWF